MRNSLGRQQRMRLLRRELHRVIDLGSCIFGVDPSCYFSCSIRILYVMLVRLSCGMLLFLAWMDEPLMSHQKVTARESLVADLANEWFLFGMCAYVALQMFLHDENRC